MKRLFFIQLLLLVLCESFFSQTIPTTLTYSVHLPSRKTPKTPVLILLHGYGSNEADLFDMGKSFDPRFIVFSLRAPNQVRDDGFCWYTMEFLADKTFRYNYEDVKASRAKLRSFISNACKVYQVDSTQVFLLGFSQGAIMSYELAMSAPSKIKGVVALSGRMMSETKAHSVNATQLSKVKFFIAHGYSDNVIKIEEAEKANDFLKSKQVTDLLYKRYEMPHAIMGGELNDIQSWLTKAISPDKKPEQKAVK